MHFLFRFDKCTLNSVHHTEVGLFITAALFCFLSFNVYVQFLPRCGVPLLSPTQCDETIELLWNLPDYLVPLYFMGKEPTFGEVW